jgi:hypothetical protein
MFFYDALLEYIHLIEINILITWEIVRADDVSSMTRQDWDTLVPNFRNRKISEV